MAPIEKITTGNQEYYEKVIAKKGAEEFLEDASSIGPWKNELLGVKILTTACEYLDENVMQDAIEELELNIEEIEEANRKIDVLINEKATKDAENSQRAEKIATLEAKEKDGTITEEEQQELDTLRLEQEGASTDSYNDEIASLTGNINTKSESIATIDAKIEKSFDYGELTLEKGTEYANKKDKRKSFWRKTFGGWDKSAYREAGNAAVEAANDLLESAETAKDLNKKLKSTKKQSN